MPRNSFRSRRSGGKASAKEFIIGFLCLVVLVESYLLIRPFLRQKKPVRIAAVTDRPRHKESPAPLFREPHKTPTPKTSAPKTPVPQKTPVLTKGKGKIAIIIDDNGYSTKDCDQLESIPQPFTIAILPAQKFSRYMAYCAHDRDKGIMLHMPMEPHANKDRYPKNYIIRTDMPEALIRSRLSDSLADIPYVQGVNNHMGSKATEDRRLMSIVLEEMRAKNLFFIDSLVTSKSICHETARANHVPFAQRNVFLDNVNSRKYIENQFQELAQKARENGKAIGIGHARPLTWQILKEQLPKLENEGYEILTIKDLLSSSAP